MKDAISSDIRSQRGLAIAQAKKESIKPLIGTKYLVPSAAANGSTYVVDTKAESCSCLDWSKLGGNERSHRCKHLWAVYYVLKLADGSELLVTQKPRKPKEQRKTFQRNWKATNVCRTLIPHVAPHYCELLVDGLGLRGRVLGENGRPEVPLRDVLLTALIRTFEKLTAAEAVVRVRLYCDTGLIHMTQIPSYNTLLRVFAEPEHMVLFHRLLAGSALPLIGLESTFAVDGTGFGTSVYDHHFAQKHGPESAKRLPTLRSNWLNATIVFGLRTLVAPAAQVTDKIGESPLMPELVRRVIAGGGRIAEWLGDSAYNSWYNVRAVEEVGATPYFDFRDNVTGKTRPETVGRLYQRMRDDQDLYWERYSPRTLAEAGMNSIKSRFGHSLKSRVLHAQCAEVMLRLISHNIAQLITAVEELNVDPRYWAQDLISKLPDFGTAQPPESALERLTVSAKETR